jgi:glycosyltransferase involved in cell wall biosynthesis
MLWTGPIVVTAIDMIHERFSHLFNTPDDEHFRQLKRQCIAAADKVICISETTRHDVQDFLGVDSQRTEVIPLACSNSFRVTETGAELGLAPAIGPYLLYVGMRRDYKNFRLLLEAYSHWGRQTEVSLITVGAPWSDKEAQYLESLGIADRVYLMTDVDDEVLCQLYNHASAFVYPSLYEGFGIPLLEAMACGCPIIASRIPSTVEVARECPIYFEPTESEDLMAAFDIAMLEGRASERARRGIQHSKRFSWDESARQTLGVYRDVTESR